MAKSLERIKARNLRRDGQSIKQIAKQLHVSVSSVSTWCKDIMLTQQQWRVLDQRRSGSLYKYNQVYILKKKEETKNKIAILRQQGVNELGKLTNREIFLIGIALYWGEGFKKDNCVGLATSDPHAALFFIYWLELCFKIKKDDLITRVTANISYKNSIQQIQKYWSDTLNIELSQFSKPFFQNTSWKKVYENKNGYYGVIRIKARKSVNLLRKIFGYFDGINQALLHK